MNTPVAIIGARESRAPLIIGQRPVKPPVREISWEQMILTINAAGRKKLAYIAELKLREDGSLSRGQLSFSSLSGVKLALKTAGFYVPRSGKGKWSYAGYSGYEIPLTGPVDLPVELASGRIFFTVKEVEFMLYPHGSGALCPKP